MCWMLTQSQASGLYPPDLRRRIWSFWQSSMKPSMRLANSTTYWMALEICSEHCCHMASQLCRTAGTALRAPSPRLHCPPPSHCTGQGRDPGHPWWVLAWGQPGCDCRRIHLPILGFGSSSSTDWPSSSSPPSPLPQHSTGGQPWPLLGAAAALGSRGGRRAVLTLLCRARTSSGE